MVYDRGQSSRQIFGKTYSRKRKGQTETERKRKALRAVGASSWNEVAGWLNSVGREVRPSLQVATFTWCSNKQPLTIPPGGVCSLLSSYPSGSSDFQRHTNRTVTYKVDSRMVVAIGTPDIPRSFKIRCYWWLVYDKSPAGITPAVDSIFDTFYKDFPNTWCIHRDMCHRFVVKAKWVNVLSSNGVDPSKSATAGVVPADVTLPCNKFFKRLGVTTEWRNSQGGDIGDVKEGALYIVGASSGGQGHSCYAYAKFRVYFKSVGLQ